MVLFWIIQNIDCMCFLNFRTSKIPTFCQLLFFFCNYWHNVNKQLLKSRETCISLAKMRHANWRIYSPKKSSLFLAEIYDHKYLIEFFQFLIFSAPPSARMSLKFLKKPLWSILTPKNKKISICFKFGIAVDHKITAASASELLNLMFPYPV